MQPRLILLRAACVSGRIMEQGVKTRQKRVLSSQNILPLCIKHHKAVCIRWVSQITANLFGCYCGGDSHTTTRAQRAGAQMPVCCGPQNVFHLLRVGYSTVALQPALPMCNDQHICVSLSLVTLSAGTQFHHVRSTHGKNVKRPLERPRRRWEYNINVYLKRNSVEGSTLGLRFRTVCWLLWAP
jgi:hypothetical protein